MFSSSARDLRIGFRLLWRDKAFAALAVGVLALGICAVATQFSVVDAVLIRGFSFPTAGRLESVRLIDPARTTPYQVRSQVFALDYLDLAREQRSLDELAAYLDGSTVNMTIDGHAKRFTGAYVTESFLRALGVQPVLGRDFVAADDVPGAPKVAILSHLVWQRDFGGDPSVVGKAVRINGKPASIVGVMAKGFAFPGNEELWVPLFNEFPPLPRNDPNGNTVSVIGLLKPGVSLAQVNAEFAGFARQLAASYPETNKQYVAALVEPLIKSFTPRQLRGLLYTMLGFCVGVLLLACTNVMNMQFARATLRARDLAIRASLGATRGRLMRQMLTESSIVAALGALLGVGGAYWANALLMRAFHGTSNPIPAYIVFRVDALVLGFVVVAASVAALVSGLLPAWMASRARPAEVLRDSGRGNTGRRLVLVNRGLVIFQIVVTCVLLIGSMLQLQSIRRQQQVDYGYDTTGVLSARLGLMEGSYPDPASRQLFFERALRALRADPQYADVALTTRFQMIFSGSGPIEIEGRVYKDPRDRPNANVEAVSDGYFRTLGVKLVEGRDLSREDRDQKLPVAVVNADFAAKYFGREDPIGRRFRTAAPSGESFGPWRTIVGVVSQMRMTGPFNNQDVDESGFYVPFDATPFGPVTPAPTPPQFATVVVRPAGGRAESLAAPLRRDLAAIDPDLPLYFVATPAENAASVLSQNRVVAIMFSLFGMVAVILSAVGLYGVMSFSVSRRSQEFGTRMALGADRRRILEMVLRQGLVQLAIGLALGVGLTLLIATVGGEGIRRALFQVDPRDPLTYLGVSTLIAVVAFVATLVPARRATRVDPMLALRSE